MKDKLSGTFLTIALILSNYTGGIFGKDFLKIINKYYFSRLIILYILIFMTIKYESDYPNHHIHFMRTNIIFIIFLMAVKSNTKNLITIIILTIINRLLDHHLEYLEQRNEQKSEEYQKINTISRYTTYLIVLMSILGFIYEIYKRSKNNNFSIIKYIINRS
tara:strand:- start:177 stop:662 length:486 start_codon:yes stop_codon:yes gene_type:complete